ncbi:MAG: phosphotransferase [Muribaculaceae bacterium]|nr:phosphotransferase [Muribaculaceae bacterium]
MANSESKSPIAGTLPESLSALYSECYGTLPGASYPLSGSGGDRKYWRISGSGSPAVIGCVSPDASENRTFASLASVLRSGGADVPEVYAISADGHALLQQDLGDVSLFSLFASADEEELEGMVVVAMRALARLQGIDKDLWSGAVAHASLSRRQIMWDLNYFKYEYLRPSAIPFDENLLEDDFLTLASEVEGIPHEEWGFMYRDCQSRNVMWHEGKPWWIDFQGGRPGPCLYDAVSFLYQARAPFSESMRRRMLKVYAGEMERLRGLPAEELLKPLGVLRLFRVLQVLGAYGLRGLVEKRAHFIRSIPGALRQLSALMEEGVLDSFPELKRIAGHIVSDPRFSGSAIPDLTVTVSSFSYMRGYPEDYSGNGGGFMFDCRAMHNPGRYEQYRMLTGRDATVADFLEQRGEVGPFLSAAEGMVIPAVKRYLERGFSSLQVGFGCTGGQHRSVYCAESMARRIRALFPQARVHLVHREQGIDEWL